MTIETKPLIEITQEAVRLLYKELGVVNTVRFLNQFTGGLGDYTSERRELLAGKTLDQIVREIRQNQEVVDHPDYKDRRRRVRRQYARAYEKWTQREDEELRRLFTAGLTSEELSARLKRQPSAVESRLRKLGRIR